MFPMMDGSMGFTPGMMGIQQAGLSPTFGQQGAQGGLVINGDLTIVNHREFGGGPDRGLFGGAAGMMITQQMAQMQLQMANMVASRNALLIDASKNERLELEMKKDVLVALLTSPTISEGVKSEISRTLKLTQNDWDGDQLNVRRIEQVEPDSSLLDTTAPAQANKIAGSKFDGDTITAEVIECASSNSIKTNPYAEYFAREDLKRDVAKSILDQMEKDKAGNIPTALVTMMRERGDNLAFDIAHVYKTNTSAWRQSVRKGIPPVSHISINGEIPTQDYLVFIYDATNKPCECVYVSAIPLERYYSMKEIDKEFENRLYQISAINLILKEEFPHIVTFTHIIEPMISDSNKYGTLSRCIKNVESNDKSEFDMDNVSTVSINGVKDTIKISIEMYTRAIRKYAVN